MEQKIRKHIRNLLFERFYNNPKQNSPDTEFIGTIISGMNGYSYGQPNIIYYLLTFDENEKQKKYPLKRIGKGVFSHDDNFFEPLVGEEVKIIGFLTSNLKSKKILFVKSILPTTN